MERDGRLESIWLKRMRKGPMDPHQAATLVAGEGIVGNANQGGRRQVTLIEQEVWQELMTSLDGELSPAARRANLMVSGIRLENSRGARVRIGECVLEIMGETKPCEQMEAALPGLRAAMYPHWRGGAFAAVVEGGVVRVGDGVELLPANHELPL